ncbi:hypothetical protein LMG28138_05562 [Pararobbsia alpina]|uniref:Uncharacterized protein n=1 Tax=Pararobbsia alpina TaxID=621374 RepID=A0A6S7C042_9BURK|nr:hypothetical protein LMG28138_05562 [Pararobbsia alpina]
MFANRKSDATFLARSQHDLCISVGTATTGQVETTPRFGLQRNAKSTLRFNLAHVDDQLASRLSWFQLVMRVGHLRQTETLRIQ